jgi:hypothetical protein
MGMKQLFVFKDSKITFFNQQRIQPFVFMGGRGFSSSWFTQNNLNRRHSHSGGDKQGNQPK